MANDLTVERVLTVVELIPFGEVVSYGDIGAIVGIGPRQVGSVLRHYGAGMPWWRVTRASGELPESLAATARMHWKREGIGVNSTGRGCAITRYRSDLDQLAAAYKARIAATLRRLGTPLPRTSNPAARALATAEITTLEELSERRRTEIAHLHGMGPQALSILDAALAEFGLQWRAGK